MKLPSRLSISRKISLAAASLLSLASLASAAVPYADANPFERASFGSDWGILSNDIFFGGADALFGLSPASKRVLLSATSDSKTASSTRYDGYVGTLRDVFNVNLFSNIAFGGSGGGPSKSGSVYVADAGSSHTWTGNTGGWSIGSNWSPPGPPTAGDSAVLTFQGSGTASYTSTNDLGPFEFSGIILSSTSTATNTIAGDELIVSLNGSSVQQTASGAFSISNNFRSSSFVGLSQTSLDLSGAGSGRVTLGGVIADATSDDILGVNKSGTSTFVLTGENTYSRGTVIDGGALLVNNIAGSGTGTGTVVVNSGGTLGGTGSLAVTGPLLTPDRTVTVNSGGTIAPGDGASQIGALTMEATRVIFAASSTFLVDLAATTSDILNIVGVLDLSALSNLIQFNVLSEPTASSYTLATYTGITGVFESTGNLPDGYTLIYGPTALLLQDLTSVPEPSTWIGAALALMAIVFTQRRRLRGLVARRA